MSVSPFLRCFFFLMVVSVSVFSWFRWTSFSLALRRSLSLSLSLARLCANQFFLYCRVVYPFSFYLLALMVFRCFAVLLDGTIKQSMRWDIVCLFANVMDLAIFNFFNELSGSALLRQDCVLIS